MLTIESNVAQIESIFITIESILITIESVSSIESVYHNRVDSEHNQVDSGAAHNTIFGSTILKQTACHTVSHLSIDSCLHCPALDFNIFLLQCEG